MNDVRQDDLEFCWRKVLINDPWFRLHFAFAPKPLVTQLLAVHALIAMLDQALNMSDEALVLAQLAWWQSELLPRSVSLSAHPVVRALRTSGALRQLGTARLEALVVQAVGQLRAGTPENREELEALCSKTGEARVSALRALEANDEADALLRGRCAAAGLHSIISRETHSERPDLWFVPLDLQALHQSSVRDISQGTASSGGVLVSLSDWEASWFDDQIMALKAGASQGAHSAKIIRYLVALGLSERLRFRRYLENMHAGNWRSPGRWRLADFLGIWRECHSRSSGDMEN